jgi:hypothetical protein
MNRVVLASVMLLASCDATQIPGGGGGLGDRTSGSSAFQEFLVIGSAMSFEDCRARGGLIIHDNGSPMTACDPSVQRRVLETEVPAGPDGTELQTAREAADLRGQSGG